MWIQILKISRQLEKFCNILEVTLIFTTEYDAKALFYVRVEILNLLFS